MQYKINKMLNFCFDDIQKIDFQLFLITVKCLIPYDDKIGCLFDKDRYKKEIELFASYMNANDELIDYWLQNKEASNLEDNLLEYKIIPLALSAVVNKVFAPHIGIKALPIFIIKLLGHLLPALKF
jgi:hypothetical protein